MKHRFTWTTVGLILAGTAAIAIPLEAFSQALPDTAANRRRGVVGCTQTSSGITCPGAPSAPSARGYSYDGGMGAYNLGASLGNAMWQTMQAIERQAHQQRMEMARNLNDQGVALYNSGEYQSALAAFRNGLQYSPYSPTLLANIQETEKRLIEHRAEAERQSRAQMAAAKERITAMLGGLAEDVAQRNAELTAAGNLSFVAPAGTSFFGTGGGPGSAAASGDSGLAFVGPGESLFSRGTRYSAPVDLRDGASNQLASSQPIGAGSGARSLEGGGGLKFVGPDETLKATVETPPKADVRPRAAREKASETKRASSEIALKSPKPGEDGEKGSLFSKGTKDSPPPDLRTASLMPIWLGGEPQYTANALKEGDRYFANKDWEAAVRCYEEMLRFYPGNVDAQKKLALAKKERDAELQRYAERPRQYTYSDNGLVEGTTRIIGYNVPNGFDERQRAEAGEKLDQLLKLAGKNPAEFSGLKDYDFIIGVGTAYSLEDLVRRVWPGDQFNQGRTSVQQPLYASLRGRQFDQLDCHSNGAMVCLAALDLNDVKATHVRLYGPQITPASVESWQRLIETGKIRSLQIVINRGDPVPRAAYATSFQAAPTTLGSVLLSDDLLATDVKKRAPGIQFKFADCPDRSSGWKWYFDTKCHDIRLYQANVAR